MHKISIILPVHNGEKYLDTLLSAFRKQSFAAFICYVVNDGSSDSSELIIRKYCSVDTRFVLLSQSHLGKFAGFNLGLKQRQFEYILFWDSLDTPSPQMLEVLYTAIQEHDMAITAVGENTDELLPVNIENVKSYPHYDLEALIRIALTAPREDVLSGVLIRCSLVNNIRFLNTSQKYADMQFFIRLLSTATSLVYVDALLLKKHKKDSVYGIFDRGTLASSALDTLQAIMDDILKMEEKYHRLGLEYTVNKSIDLAIFLRKESGDIPFYAKTRIKSICRHYWKWFIRSRHAGALSRIYASLLCVSYRAFHAFYASIQFLKKFFHKTGLYWGAYPKKLHRKELKELQIQSKIPKRKRKKFWENW